MRNDPGKNQSEIELVPLRRDEIRRMPKPHPGWEKLARPLADVVRDFPNAIGREGIDLEALASDIAALEALEPLCEEAEQHRRLLVNTRFLHSSKGWAQVLLMYDRARTAARTNPAIARALEPFELFLKHKKKHVRKKTPT